MHAQQRLKAARTRGPALWACEPKIRHGPEAHVRSSAAAQGSGASAVVGAHRGRQARMPRPSDEGSGSSAHCHSRQPAGAGRAVPPQTPGVAPSRPTTRIPLPQTPLPQQLPPIPASLQRPATRLNARALSNSKRLATRVPLDYDFSFRPKGPCVGNAKSKVERNRNGGPPLLARLQKLPSFSRHPNTFCTQKSQNPFFLELN